MPNCEAYIKNHAFLESDYKGNPGISVVLCSLENCPYNKQGDKVPCRDKKTRHICHTDGEVEETGLLQHLTEVDKAGLIDRIESDRYVRKIIRSNLRRVVKKD